MFQLLSLIRTDSLGVSVAVWRYTAAPLLRLSISEDAPVLVAPGLLRESLLMMMHNYCGAEFDYEFLISSKMQRWWSIVQERDGKDFEQLVCAELQKMGWSVAKGRKFSEILGRRLPHEPGDIDVLAWRTEWPDSRA